jgi:hypothetical protein
MDDMDGGSMFALFLLIAVSGLFWLHLTGKLTGIAGIITHNAYSVTASNPNGQTATYGNQTNASTGSNLAALSTEIDTPSGTSSGNAAGTVTALATSIFGTILAGL